MPGADPAPGRAMESDPAGPEIFGPYRLDEILGRGGMGEVFRAFDTRRNRVVALKRMARHLAFDPEYRMRFQRESALAARLREPHIIPIHDYGEIDGRLYIDMRLVEGTNLATMLKRQILSVERVVDVISQIADALDAAHAEGLVHRDVKPSNILLVGGVHDNSAAARGFVYLADFGVAATLGGSTLSQPGLAAGTATYMAPERMMGDHWDHRIDVYALACVLYECLTGRFPFGATELLVLLQAHLKLPPPRPSDLRRDLPRGIDAVIATGMAKNPGDRYPSAGALALAAQELLGTDSAFPVPAVVRPGSVPAETRASTLSSSETEQAMPAVGRVGPPPPVAPKPITPPVVVPSAITPAAAVPTAVNPTTVIPPEATPAPVIPATVEGPTVEVALPTPDAGSDDAPETRERTPRVVAVAAIVVVALAVATIVLLLPRAPRPVAGPTTLTLLTSIKLGVAPAEIAVSPDGTRAYVTNLGADTVSVVDTSTFTIVGTPIAVGDAPNSVLVAPDGARVYVTNNGSDSVSVIDSATAKVDATIGVGDLPDGLAMGPQGRQVYVGNARSGTVSVIDTATDKVIGRPIPVGNSPFGLAISPDGSRLFVPAFEGKSVAVVDTVTSAVVATIPVGDGPLGTAVSPDGARLYVTNQRGGTVSVIDTAALAVIGDPIPIGDAPTGIAISPDGDRLFVTARDSDTVTTIITTADRTTGDPIPVGDAPVAITVSPDGERVYVVNEKSNDLTVLTSVTG